MSMESPLPNLYYIFIVVISLIYTPKVLADKESTNSSSQKVALAEDYASQAFNSYQNKDYATAVSLYLKAYETVASADILYNIAKIYDVGLKDRPLAINFYRRYILDPGAVSKRIKSASERLAQLRAAEDAFLESCPTDNENQPAGKTTIDKPTQSQSSAAQLRAAEDAFLETFTIQNNNQPAGKTTEGKPTQFQSSAAQPRATEEDFLETFTIQNNNQPAGKTTEGKPTQSQSSAAQPRVAEEADHESFPIENKNQPAGRTTEGKPTQSQSSAERTDKETSSDSWSTVSILGLVTTIAGVAALGVGAGFGIAALSDAEITRKECEGNLCESQEAVDAAKSGNTKAAISTTGVSLGGGLVAVGVLLWFLGSKDSEKQKDGSFAMDWKLSAKNTQLGLSAVGRW